MSQSTSFLSDHSCEFNGTTWHKFSVKNPDAFITAFRIDAARALKISTGNVLKGALQRDGGSSVLITCRVRHPMDLTVEEACKVLSSCDFPLLQYVVAEQSVRPVVVDHVSTTTAEGEKEPTFLTYDVRFPGEGWDQVLADNLARMEAAAMQEVAAAVGGQTENSISPAPPQIKTSYTPSPNGDAAVLRCVLEYAELSDDTSTASATIASCLQDYSYPLTWGMFGYYKKAQMLRSPSGEYLFEPSLRLLATSSDSEDPYTLFSRYQVTFARDEWGAVIHQREEELALCIKNDVAAALHLQPEAIERPLLTTSQTHMMVTIDIQQDFNSRLDCIDEVLRRSKFKQSWELYAKCTAWRNATVLLPTGVEEGDGVVDGDSITTRHQLNLSGSWEETVERARPAIVGALQQVICEALQLNSSDFNVLRMEVVNGELAVSMLLKHRMSLPAEVIDSRLADADYQAVWDLCRSEEASPAYPPEAVTHICDFVMTHHAIHFDGNNWGAVVRGNPILAVENFKSDVAHCLHISEESVINVRFEESANIEFDVLHAAELKQEDVAASLRQYGYPRTWSLYTPTPQSTAMCITHHRLYMIGGAQWEDLLAHSLSDLVDAVKADIADCVGTMPSAVNALELSVADNFQLEFDVAHDGSVDTDEISKMISTAPFTRTWELYTQYPTVATEFEFPADSTSQGVTTTSHTVCLDGDSWSAVLAASLRPVSNALKQDVTDALLLPIRSVTDVTLSVGSLRAAFKVSHPETMEVKDIDETLANASYPNLWAIYAAATKAGTDDQPQGNSPNSTHGVSDAISDMHQVSAPLKGTASHISSDALYDVESFASADELSASSSDVGAPTAAQVFRHQESVVLERSPDDVPALHSHAMVMSEMDVSCLGSDTDSAQNDNHDDRPIEKVNTAAPIVRTTHHSVSIPGDRWRVVIDTNLIGLQAAFIRDLEVGSSIAPDRVQNVACRVGSLIVDFDLVHDGNSEEDDIINLEALLAENDFLEVNKLYPHGDALDYGMVPVIAHGYKEATESFDSLDEVSTDSDSRMPSRMTLLAAEEVLSKRSSGSTLMAVEEVGSILSAGGNLRDSESFMSADELQEESTEEDERMVTFHDQVMDVPLNDSSMEEARRPPEVLSAVDSFLPEVDRTSPTVVSMHASPEEAPALINQEYVSPSKSSPTILQASESFLSCDDIEVNVASSLPVDPERMTAPCIEMDNPSVEQVQLCTSQDETCAEGVSLSDEEYDSSSPDIARRSATDTVPMRDSLDNAVLMAREEGKESHLPALSSEESFMSADEIVWGSQPMLTELVGDNAVIMAAGLTPAEQELTGEALTAEVRRDSTLVVPLSADASVVTRPALSGRNLAEAFLPSLRGFEEEPSEEPRCESATSDSALGIASCSTSHMTGESAEGMASLEQLSPTVSDRALCSTSHVTGESAEGIAPLEQLASTTSDAALDMALCSTSHVTGESAEGMAPLEQLASTTSDAALRIASCSTSHMTGESAEGMAPLEQLSPTVSDRALCSLSHVTGESAEGIAPLEQLPPSLSASHNADAASNGIIMPALIAAVEVVEVDDDDDDDKDQDPDFSGITNGSEQATEFHAGDTVYSGGSETRYSLNDYEEEMSRPSESVASSRKSTARRNYRQPVMEEEAEAQQEEEQPLEVEGGEEKDADADTDHRLTVEELVEVSPHMTEEVEEVEEEEVPREVEPEVEIQDAPLEGQADSSEHPIPEAVCTIPPPRVIRSERVKTRHRVGFVGEQWPEVLRTRKEELTAVFLAETSETIGHKLHPDISIECDETTGDTVITFKVTHPADVRGADLDVALREAPYQEVWRVYYTATIPRQKAPEGATFHRIGFIGEGWNEIVENNWARFCEEFIDDTALALGVPVGDVRIVDCTLRDDVVVDMFVFHPPEVAEADIDDKLDRHEYLRVWDLYSEATGATEIIRKHRISSSNPRASTHMKQQPEEQKTLSKGGKPAHQQNGSVVKPLLSIASDPQPPTASTRRPTVSNEEGGVSPRYDRAAYRPTPAMMDLPALVPYPRAQRLNSATRHNKRRVNLRELEEKIAEKQRVRAKEDRKQKSSRSKDRSPAMQRLSDRPVVGDSKRARPAPARADTDYLKSQLTSVKLLDRLNNTAVQRVTPRRQEAEHTPAINHHEPARRPVQRPRSPIDYSDRFKPYLKRTR